MPIDYKRYPPDWKAISERIRFKRAQNRCEWCGVPNGAIILRSIKDGSRYIIQDDEGVWHTPEGEAIRLSEIPDEFNAQERETKVILTVAHLGVDHPDGTPGDKHDKMDVRDENLAALCQRCHLLYDLPDHIANAKRTRLRRKQQAIEEAGQLRLL